LFSLRQEFVCRRQVFSASRALPEKVLPDTPILELPDKDVNRKY
jgi:hypothetical protein